MMNALDTVKAAEASGAATAAASTVGRMDATVLRIGRVRDAHAALGLAVEALLRSPAFARLRFGPWSRVLVGQINRGHYALALRDRAVVGFLGYGLCSVRTAEQWLHADREPTSAECTAGPCLLINAWQADDRSVLSGFMAHLRRVGRGSEAIAAKRVYADGRVRPVWLTLR